jgi:fructokinase
MTQETPCFGIDLGGTKIEGIVIFPSSPEAPLCRLRIPTEANLGYDRILENIKKICGLLCHNTSLPLPAKIGIGTPGVPDPISHVMKGCNTICLNGRSLRKDLEATLGIKIAIANDANCCALAEATCGAAQGFETVFGVIMGTGVGGGIVVRGNVLEGRHGIAGEWGQIVLDPHGPTSVYGTKGTIEALISGPALEKFYEAKSGRHSYLKEIVERAHTGTDSAANATITHLTDRFADAITIIINTLDPHAIVIGGGVGNIDELYSESTREKIRSRIFNKTFETPLLRPLLGDSAGVFGAAMLSLDQPLSNFGSRCFQRIV